MSFKIQKELDKNVKVFLEDLLNNTVKDEPYLFCNMSLETCYLPNTIRLPESYINNNPLTLGPCTIHTDTSSSLRDCDYRYVDLNFKRINLTSKFFYEELDNLTRNKIARTINLDNRTLDEKNIPNKGISVRFKTKDIDVYSFLTELLYGMSLSVKEIINITYLEIPFKLYVKFDNPVLLEKDKQEIEELVSLL